MIEPASIIYRSLDEKNIKVPLANKILSLDGTVMVFFGANFITVKKEKNLNWENLKYSVISEINQYYNLLMVILSNLQRKRLKELEAIKTKKMEKIKKVSIASNEALKFLAKCEDDFKRIFSYFRRVNFKIFSNHSG